MNTSESFQALRRANPRARADVDLAVEAVADAVRAQIATTSTEVAKPRRRLVRIGAVGASLTAVAAVAAFLTIGSSANTPGVESAAAAVTKAATVTAASAERSGTAVVRITHNGQPWAGKTVRWNGADLAIAEHAHPSRPSDRGLRIVDGTLYGSDADGGWIVLGTPESIDPDSGTTPGEHLAAVREDIGGVTLRRITAGMTGLTTHWVADGSTVYRGTVAAGLIARETGFKEGQPIRVLPFGYVAPDEAADPAAGLDAAVTVGADRIVREIAVKWGAGTSAWIYTVTYSKLGATPTPAPPPNARPPRDRTPAWPPTEPINGK